MSNYQNKQFLYHFILNFLISGKHKKLVIAEIIINHLNPIIGNNHAPVSVDAVPAAKLDTEHNNAKEVASLPFIVDSARNVIIIK